MSERSAMNVTRRWGARAGGVFEDELGRVGAQSSAAGLSAVALAVDDFGLLASIPSRKLVSPHCLPLQWTMEL